MSSSTLLDRSALIAQGVLGIDVGNTITKKGQPLPDSLRVIRWLSERYFRDRIFIVSKVTLEQEIRVRRFLTNEPFTTETRIPIERARFCRERCEKGPICEELGITHMIDDRPEVMAHMPASVKNKILFDPDPVDLATYESQIQPYHIVRNWNEVQRYFAKLYGK